MRAYRWLLRLYPASFRHAYGNEMAAIFRRALREAGFAGRPRVWAAAVLEVLAGATAAHCDILRQDLRYTVRSLRRSPGFTATAALLLAIGIGANTAAFSVADLSLLRPLPFDNPDRLVTLWQRTPGYARFELSPENYRDWKRQSTSFSSMGAHWTTGANLFVHGADPQRLTGTLMTWDVLPTLGIQPQLGRGFTAEEDVEGGPAVVLLSAALWRALFAGDPSAIGREVILNDRPHTVVGVMPDTFAFPSRETEFWAPFQLSPNDTDRTNTYLRVVARLAPGVTVARAQDELESIAARLAAAFPKENAETSAAVVRMSDEVPRQSRMLLLALSGAALCVLLIASVNLANLLLARALARRREIALRAAIGAGRERLVRQLATESAVLALAGGALGIGLALLALPLLAPLAPASLPTAATPSLDRRVLAFSIALTALTAIAFGLLPAARIQRGMDAAGLREGPRGGGRTERVRGALVVAEVVASVVLLVGAGLLIRALWTIQRVDPGFRADGVLTLQTVLPWPKYAPTAKRAAYYATVLDGVRALPGVGAAGFTSGLPMVMRGGIWMVELPGDGPGQQRASRAVSLRFITAGFFRALEIPILQGRDVSDADTRDTQFVAVVSESFARQHFPGEDPIGRRFSVAFFERTIAGVVADVRNRGLESPSEPQVYLPHGQIPDGFMPTYAPKSLVVRGANPMTLVPAIREIVRRADPREPISEVRLLSDVVSQETASRSGQVQILVTFAAIALLLSAIGIHGVLAFAVSQRTQEFGIRIALGATSADLARMVLRRSAVLAAAGALPGLALAYATGRSLQALLAGVPAADPPTFVAVLVLTIVMTLGGSLAPARRALRLDPVDALRRDT